MPAAEMLRRAFSRSIETVIIIPGRPSDIRFIHLRIDKNQVSAGLLPHRILRAAGAAYLA